MVLDIGFILKGCIISSLMSWRWRLSFIKMIKIQSLDSHGHGQHHHDHPLPLPLVGGECDSRSLLVIFTSSIELTVCGSYELLAWELSFPLPNWPEKVKKESLQVTVLFSVGFMLADEVWAILLFWLETCTCMIGIKLTWCWMNFDSMVMILPFKPLCDFRYIQMLHYRLRWVVGVYTFCCLVV